MTTFIKTLIMVALMATFCVIAGDAEEKAVKDFSFAAFMLGTTIVVCWGKKTEVEHRRSKTRQAQRS